MTAVLTAMVLAAGRGERMRPLTDKVPKPLLEVGGQSLIARHMVKLAAAGFKRVIVNHAHLGTQIEAALGDGAHWGLSLSFSAENEALETAGGIANALTLINADTFAVVNADVYSDYDYRNLATAIEKLAENSDDVAHLVLVDNPEHHSGGDFALGNGKVLSTAGKMLTFSGLAAYHRKLFSPIPAGTKKRLAPLLRDQIRNGRVTGEHHAGCWSDVGTPHRLAVLNAKLQEGTN